MKLVSITTQTIMGYSPFKLTMRVHLAKSFYILTRIKKNKNLETMIHFTDWVVGKKNNAILQILIISKVAYIVVYQFCSGFFFYSINRATAPE